MASRSGKLAFPAGSRVGLKTLYQIKRKFIDTICECWDLVVWDRKCRLDMLTLQDGEIEPIIVAFDLIVEEREGAVTEVLENEIEDIGICVDEVRSIHEQITLPGASKQCREEAALGQDIFRGEEFSLADLKTQWHSCHVQKQRSNWWKALQIECVAE